MKHVSTNKNWSTVGNNIEVEPARMGENAYINNN